MSTEHSDALFWNRLRELERRLAATEKWEQACPIQEFGRELSAHRVMIDKASERADAEAQTWDARLVRIEQKLTALKTWLLSVLATSAGSLLLLILSKLLD